VLINFILYAFALYGFFFCAGFSNSVKHETVQVFSQLAVFFRKGSKGRLFVIFFFLSMGGVPPFPGFFSKLGLLAGLGFSRCFFFFLLVSVLNLLVFFYSLRIVTPVAFSEMESTVRFDVKNSLESRLSTHCLTPIFFFMFLVVFNFFPILHSVASFFVFKLSWLSF